MNAPTIAHHLQRPRERYTAPSKLAHAVREVFLSARVPVTVEAAAQRADASPSLTRGIAQRLVRQGVIHNARGHDEMAAYLPGPAPVTRPIGAALPRGSLWERPDADPHYRAPELQPYTGRPGAMRAFELPSLVNGQSVPRVAPRLIAAQPDRKP